MPHCHYLLKRLSPMRYVRLRCLSDDALPARGSGSAWWSWCWQLACWGRRCTTVDTLSQVGGTSDTFTVPQHSSTVANRSNRFITANYHSPDTRQLTSLLVKTRCRYFLRPSFATKTVHMYSSAAHLRRLQNTLDKWNNININITE